MAGSNDRAKRLFCDLDVLTSRGTLSNVKIPDLKAGVGTIVVFVRVVAKRSPS
jgi:hypothetical protein